MYGIFTVIYHTNAPHLGKYAIHGSYGILIYIYIFTYTHCTRRQGSGQRNLNFSGDKQHVVWRNLWYPTHRDVEVLQWLFVGGFELQSKPK